MPKVVWGREVTRVADVKHYKSDPTVVTGAAGGTNFAHGLGVAPTLYAASVMSGAVQATVYLETVDATNIAVKAATSGAMVVVWAIP